MGPEIVKKEPYQGKAADVWAIGVLIYKLLVGEFPFVDVDDQSLTNRITNGNFRQPKNVSSEARSLINLCLKTDPLERITSSNVKFRKFLLPTLWPNS